jgi:dTDP-4-dehydrorhamnose reductase
MRLCVTGTRGQVSSALQAVRSPGLEVIALGRPSCDLADQASVAAAIDAARPDVIVNAAAYTAVDLAETEREQAFQVNDLGAGHVAAAAADIGIPLLHLSTDYVFDGRKPTPYQETDPVAPRSVYGASKRAGEERVLAANPKAVVLRTSWVFSHGGTNFLRTMLRLAATHDRVRVVSDQFGAPTYAPDLAEACVTIARRIVSEPENEGLFGIFHVGGGGDTSWAGFASAIFSSARARGLKAADVQPIATSDYPTAAARPANSRLDCARVAEVHGVRLPHWADAMNRCLDRIAELPAADARPATGS